MRVRVCVHITTRYPVQLHKVLHVVVEQLVLEWPLFQFMVKSRYWTNIPVKCDTTTYMAYRVSHNEVRRAEE
jgi:hypothetical protein